MRPLPHHTQQREQPPAPSAPRPSPRAARGGRAGAGTQRGAGCTGLIAWHNPTLGEHWASTHLMPSRRNPISPQPLSQPLSSLAHVTASLARVDRVGNTAAGCMLQRALTQRTLAVGRGSRGWTGLAACRGAVCHLHSQEGAVCSRSYAIGHRACHGPRGDTTRGRDAGVRREHGAACSSARVYRVDRTTMAPTTPLQPRPLSMVGKRAGAYVALLQRGLTMVAPDAYLTVVLTAALESLGHSCTSLLTLSFCATSRLRALYGDADVGWTAGGASCSSGSHATHTRRAHTTGAAALLALKRVRHTWARVRAAQRPVEASEGGRDPTHVVGRCQRTATSRDIAWSALSRVG
jgi:hypothetical protein